MPFGWERNRSSSFALAMRHRLQWFIHLQALGVRKGDEHPAYSSHGVWQTFPLSRKITPFWICNSRPISFLVAEKIAFHSGLLRYQDLE